MSRWICFSEHISQKNRCKRTKTKSSLQEMMHKMTIGFDVFGAFKENIIMGIVNHTLIITKHKRARCLVGTRVL